jgi:hypothetical protein
MIEPLLKGNTPRAYAMPRIVEIAKRAHVNLLAQTFSIYILQAV